MEGQKARTGNIIMKKKKAEGLILHYFKTYMATIINIVWNWWKNKYKQDRLDNSEADK